MQPSILIQKPVEKKVYHPPKILHELVLETRAGSPNLPNPWDISGN